MRTLIFLFVSLLISTFQLKTVEADELLKTEKELIAWLDELGYQDLSKAAESMSQQANGTRAVTNRRKIRTSSGS